MNTFCLQEILAIRLSDSYHSYTSHTMKCLTLIVLLMTASSSDGLSCMTPEEHGKYFSFVDLNYEELFKRFEDSPTTEDSPDAVCRVSVKLNYHDKTLIMRFTTDVLHTELEFGDIAFDTSVYPRDDGTYYVESQLENICSGNGCEIAFVKDHLPGLINVRFPTLVENAIPLLTLGYGEAGKNFTRLLVEDFGGVMSSHAARRASATNNPFSIVGKSNS